MLFAIIYLAGSDTMKLLFELDENNYKGKSKIFKRTAVRSVIFIDNKLVMIKSSKYGECKFIGGGVKTDESHFDTLKEKQKKKEVSSLMMILSL